ncbi:hypothetical protein DP939_18735 [Spongiactinospora rosea]|uniref:Uncharacterized protein n=1 Tax=Spongiactinospora rosea TaxID=2248750 RepID=A0A366LX48_9ACTN|nr:hypothetical protein DP939_18735 [Spongiactinospora rosea]
MREGPRRACTRRRRGRARLDVLPRRRTARRSKAGLCSRVRPMPGAGRRGSGRRGGFRGRRGGAWGPSGTTPR